jgi:hypothetical protein
MQNPSYVSLVSICCAMAISAMVIFRKAVRELISGVMNQKLADT